MSKVITNINDVRIGRIIRLERQARELSQTDVATAIGIDQSTYAQYELGKRPVPANRVSAIAAVFDLETRYVNPKAA